MRTSRFSEDKIVPASIRSCREHLWTRQSSYADTGLTRSASRRASASCSTSHRS